jgi:hypothetical protein
MNQHLIRSIIAIRKQGGVTCWPTATADARPDPDRPQRRQDRSAGQAPTACALGHRPRRRAGNKDDTIFFDAAPRRCALPCWPRPSPPASTSTAKNRSPPTWRRSAGAAVSHGEGRGIKHGVVQDKLFLPGLLKLKMLATPASSAASSRCAASSATGCSRATGSRPAPELELPQAEDGGGIILDMLCHWRYVLDNLFGEVKAVSLPRRHAHSRSASTRRASPTPPTADDAAYATFQLEGGKCRPDQQQLGRPCGATTWSPSRSTAPMARRSPAFAVGAFHSPRGRRRALPLDPARRRQGGSTGRGRPAKLEGTALGGCPAAIDLIATHAAMARAGALFFP